MARTRIDELRICIIDLVDARFLGKVKRQHTAVNRAFRRLSKFVRTAIHDDVVRVQTELIRHRVRRAIRRIRTRVLRPREIHNHRAAKVNPVPVQRHADGRDVVLDMRIITVIDAGRRIFPQHLVCPVVDLLCVGRCEGKGRVVYIDCRPLNISLPVAVRIELIVPGIASEGCIHRCREPCILHILVRPRIGIRGKARTRTFAVVAYDIRRRARCGQIRELVGDGKPRHITVQHCCIGIRNRRINRRIFRKTVIGFMLLAKGDIYLALCDRIPRLWDGRSNRGAVVFDVVVARTCGIQLDIVGDRLIRPHVLIIKRRRRGVRRVVARDKPHEFHEVVCRHNRCARCRVLCRTDRIRRRIIDLRQGALDGRRDILRCNDAVALTVKGRRPGREGKVAACALVFHVICHARLRTAHDVFRIILCRLQFELGEDADRAAADRHGRVRDVVLDRADGIRAILLDLHPAVVFLRRECRRQRDVRGCELQRRDLAQSHGRRIDGIVIRRRAAKRESGVVDPVLLRRAVNGLCRAIAAHVRTLECLRMRKGNVIASDHTVRARLELHIGGGDIRRTVIDLRDLFKGTRKILRRDLSCRRKFKSVLRIRRCRCAVGKRIVARIARPRDVDVIFNCFVNDIARGRRVIRDVLVVRRVRAVAVVRLDAEGRAVVHELL